MKEFSKHVLHPWHGVKPGDDAPEFVMAYIEIVPNDNVKYEVDKESGLLMIDRPQQYSNILPALYGFIPQTYCGADVAAYCMEKTARKGIVGDGDPVDVCIITSKSILHSNILVRAKPIGGLRMIDKNEADDKLIAVMPGDDMYNIWNDVSEIPDGVLAKLMHYFLTYKDMPGNIQKRCEITHTYGKDEAHEVIKRSLSDYQKLISNG
jgi:inorganic pyrophosphatase